MAAVSPSPESDPEPPSGTKRQREDALAVRRYLEALAAHRPRRGRRRSTQSIKLRLRLVESRLENAEPLARVHLIQERINLEAELRDRDSAADLPTLEAAFIGCAGSYGQSRGISYAAWKAAGVSPATLRKAGITRTGS